MFIKEEKGDEPLVGAMMLNLLGQSPRVSSVPPHYVFTCPFFLLNFSEQLRSIAITTHEICIREHPPKPVDKESFQGPISLQQSKSQKVLDQHQVPHPAPI